MSGEEKGRMLYVVAYYLGTGYQIVGAALLDVPRAKGKPMTVYRLCFSNRLNVDDKAIATALLLRCAKRLAVKGRRGGGRLTWEVDRKDAGTLGKLDEFGPGSRKRNRQSPGVATARYGRVKRAGTSVLPRKSTRVRS